MSSTKNITKTLNPAGTKTPSVEAPEVAPPPAAGNGHAAKPAAAGSGPEGQSAPPGTKSPTVEFGKSTYYFPVKKYGSVIVSVLRGGAASAPASVDCSVGSGATAAGIDSNPVTVSFRAGETQTELHLPDSVASLSADGKTVKLTLSNPQGAALGARSTAVLGLVQRSGLAGLFDDPALRRIVKHASLILFMLVMIFVCSRIFLWDAGRKADDWGRYLNPAQQQKLEFDDEFPGSETEKQRLRDQLASIRSRIGLHLEVMGYFYIRYFMAILTFAIAGALAAILLVMISKRGWEQANEYILTALFVATGSAMLYGAVPGMFQQEQNIKENKALYMKYAALENELLSFAATYEPLPPKTKEQGAPVPATAEEQTQDEEKPDPRQEVKKFIHYIDGALAEDNIAIGFDYSQIPTYKNAFEFK